MGSVLFSMFRTATGIFLPKQPRIEQTAPAWFNPPARSAGEMANRRCRVCPHNRSQCRRGLKGHIKEQHRGRHQYKKTALVHSRLIYT